jgi:hypothetical protein
MSNANDDEHLALIHGQWKCNNSIVDGQISAEVSIISRYDTVKMHYRTTSKSTFIFKKNAWWPD